MVGAHLGWDLLVGTDESLSVARGHLEVVENQCGIPQCGWEEVTLGWIDGGSIKDGH